jgi:hypothetical protein
LYRPSGEIVQIDARRAVYTVQSIKAPRSKGFDSPVIAFIDPETASVWIGQDTESVETNEFIADDHTLHTNYLTHTNLYVENGSEILSCGSVLVDGVFDGCESVIKKAQPAENLDSVIDRYDKSADSAWPLYGATWEAAFNNDFGEDFFSSGNAGSQSTQISLLAVADGKIRLQFYSLKYRTTGSVWLDLNTLKVLKTDEHT